MLIQVLKPVTDSFHFPASSNIQLSYFNNQIFHPSITIEEFVQKVSVYTKSTLQFVKENTFVHWIAF